MMPNIWRLLPAHLIVVALVGIPGLITAGCTNSSPPNEQPPATLNSQNKTHSTTPKTSPNKSEKPTQQANTPASNEQLPSSTTPTGSKQTMDLPFVGTRYFNFYGGNGTGESITIEADGATTVELHGTMNTSIEYRGPFSNLLLLPDGRRLRLEGNNIYRVSADGQIEQGCSGEGKPCESVLYEPSAAAPPILDGIYVLGGTDQGLEVSGDQYRYTDEMGAQAWRPLSELTYVKEGVIFDGNVYWCIFTESAPGVCTENGWNSLR